MASTKSPPTSTVEESDDLAKAEHSTDPARSNPNPNINVFTGDTGRPNKGPAPPGQCKFDGTDYPDWLPVNPFKKADEPFTFPFPEVKGDPWANAAQMVKDFDNNMCTAWVDEIQNILIFAGLFSAIVTAFAVETQNMLQPDPAVASVLLLAHLSGQLGNSSSPISIIAAPFQNENNPTHSVRINALIYSSLVLSLGTALIGIIALQWIRSYRHSDPQTYKDRIDLRHARYESLMNWKVPQIISALPLVLQVSLVIFFVGLVDFLQSLNTNLTIIISSLIATIILFVVFTMIAPGISIVKISVRIRSYTLRTPQTLCPYQSPQSWLFAQMVLFMQRIFSRLAPFPNMGELLTLRSTKMPEAKNWPQLAIARGRYMHRSSKPRDATVLGWMLKNFTQDVESFCSLFHCFQTLEIYEMKATTLQLSEPFYSIQDALATVQKSAEDNKIAPLEATHIFSTFLLEWAQGCRYWNHIGIGLHSSELLLRSATYALPPESPDTQMVPSRLRPWNGTLPLGPLAFNNGLRPSETTMFTFANLVSLRQLASEPNSSFFVPQSHYEFIPMDIFLLHVDFHIRHNTLNVVDDFLMVMRNSLEIWLTTNPDEEVNISALAPRMLYRFIRNIQAHNFNRSTILMQRPNMFTILDCLATHPKGQRFWKAYHVQRDLQLSKITQIPVRQQVPHPDYPAWSRWDKMLVDAFLERRCPALLYDQERVKALVEERDTPALTHATENGIDPNPNGHRQETVLKADISQHAAYISNSESHIPAETCTRRDSHVLTSDIASPNAGAITIQVTPLYNREGVDIELGLIPSVESPQHGFIEDVVDEVEKHVH